MTFNEVSKQFGLSQSNYLNILWKEYVGTKIRFMWTWKTSGDISWTCYIFMSKLIVSQFCFMLTPDFLNTVIIGCLNGKVLIFNWPRSYFLARICVPFLNIPCNFNSTNIICHLLILRFFPFFLTQIPKLSFSLLSYFLLLIDQNYPKYGLKCGQRSLSTFNLCHVKEGNIKEYLP